MTDASFHKIMAYVCAALFIIERGNSRPTGSSLLREEDTSHVECNCFVYLNENSFFVNPKEPVCVPTSSVFDITCTLQEERDATIDRHKQWVEGVLTTAGSNMYSDAACQWEDNGSYPQCSLTFDNRHYHSSGRKVVMIEIMYQTILKTILLDVYDAEKEHPLCNPLTFTTSSIIPSIRTQRVTKHRVTTSAPFSTKKSNIVFVADNQNRHEETTIQVNDHIFFIILPAGLVLLVIIILVLLITRKWRRRSHSEYLRNVPADGGVEQHEMESSQLQGNAEGHG